MNEVEKLLKEMNVKVDLNDEYPIEFYQYNGKIELDAKINLFSFLSKHLSLDGKCEAIETEINNYLKDNKLDENITNIHNALNNLKIDLKKYQDAFSDYDDVLPIENISDTENTYNYDSILSQDIQFILFEFDGINYIALEIHYGNSILYGYSDYHIFEVNDIDYFMMYLFCIQIYCDCDEYNGINYTFDNGILYDYDGNQIENDVSNIVYVDDNNNLRCKKCNGIIKQFVCDF